MHIGLFGGSFDPVHLGHRAMAKSAFHYDIEKLFLIPCRLSPFKTEAFGKSPPADGEHRCKMLELMFHEEIQNKRMALCRFELDNPPPSYTYRTLEYFKSLYPKATFTLLLGEDSLHSLSEWAEFESWKDKVRYLVFKRGEYSIPPLEDTRLKELKIQWANEIIPPISSTIIRETIKEKGSLERLVSTEIAEYIYHHQLYL